MWRYKNRSEAGKQLAELRAQEVESEDIVVAALPRCGAPIAFEVARHLSTKIDLVVMKKLGTSRKPEFAFGSSVQKWIIGSRKLTQKRPTWQSPRASQILRQLPDVAVRVRNI